MPAGSGALAGLNWDARPRRDSPRTSASSARIPTRSTRSPTATSRSTTSTAASICAMHLSRLGGEIVLWSSQEFGFCELPDSFASGSSIMPQKKNPDAAELLRGKAPRIAASLASLLGTMHALPLAYSKDLQEDKEPLFDAIDNLELCLAAATGMLAGDQLRPGAPGGRGRGRDAGRHRPRRCSWSARGSRSARRTASSAASSGPRSSRGRPLSELDRLGARRRPRGRAAGGPPRARVGADDRVEGLARRHRLGPLSAQQLERAREALSATCAA